jgi:hypothetical protein
MSLFKTVAVLSVAVMLLPTDERRQADIAATAGATLHSALTFCERNPGPCATASEAWGVFTRKAEFGFDLAGRMIRDTMAARAGAQAEPEGKNVPAAVKRFEPEAKTAPAAAKRTEPETPRGTLTRADLAPEWRAPVRRASIDR